MHSDLQIGHSEHGFIGFAKCRCQARVGLPDFLFLAEFPTS